MSKKWIFPALTGVIFILCAMILDPAFAREARVKELARLSIEELISIRVTSVFKSPRSLSETPAAVYVITQEEIRRAGARTIPDLLRTVPGVQVAEIDENIFAISIRGFNDIHANKLLVMVDGRSVYNHIFSGVIWSHLDVFMEDIERIEIIRGPGSSVWGANAVNGVIHIITKRSQETKGTFVEFASGVPDRISGGARYGGDLTSEGAFRIHAEGVYRNRDHLSQPGFEADTRWHLGKIGFRTDWDLSESDAVSLQGGRVDYESDTEEGHPRLPEVTRRIESRTSHLMAHWRHLFADRSEAEWQAYYQREERDGDYRFEVIDLDFQHDMEVSHRHRVVWGVGYRFIGDEMIGGLFGNYTYDPEERELHLFSFFAQDTIRLLPDLLSLTAGAKVEHNDYTGFEIQPSIRMTWMPHRRHTFWGAASRAVRTPSRLDSDAATRPPKMLPEKERVVLGGSADVEAENLTALEIGYRTRPMAHLWFDIAAFYNLYDDLSTYEETEPGKWRIGNDMEGETWGMEVSIDYRPVEWWRICGVWSYLKMNMRLTDDGAADLTDYLEESNPRHQFSLHSALDLGDRLDLDVWLRHVDGVRYHRPGFTLFQPEAETDGYTTFDARLAWRPLEGVELSLTGRNLGGAHPEYTNYEVEESLFFEVTIRMGG